MIVINRQCTPAMTEASGIFEITFAKFCLPDSGASELNHVIGQIDGGTLDAMFLEKQGGYNAQQDTNEMSAQSADVEFGNMYAREIESFSDSLLHGMPVEVPASEAVYVQRVMEAAYDSSKDGCLKILPLVK